MSLNRLKTMTVNSCMTVLLATLPIQAGALVMCAGKKSAGVVREGTPIILRQACKPKEQTLSLTSLGTEISTLVTTTSAMSSELSSLKANYDASFGSTRNALDQISSGLAAVSSKGVTTYPFHGSVDAQGTNVSTISNNWQFIGGTTSISGAGGKNIMGTAVAVLGTSGTTAYNVEIDLCYQANGGVITKFSTTSKSWLFTEINKPYQTLPITDEVPLPADVADPVTVGYCAYSYNGANLDRNDYVNGVIIVTGK